MDGIVFGGVVPVLLGLASLVAAAVFKPRSHVSQQRVLIGCALGSYLVCAGSSRLAEPHEAVSTLFSCLSLVAAVAFAAVVFFRLPRSKQPAHGNAV